MRNEILDYKQADRIAQIAIEYGLGVESFEGTLVDEYIIYADKALFVRGLPRAKYVILESHYLNCWSSGLKVILTNSDKKAQQWVESREAQLV